ncbi:MFS transporter [Natronospirillum operosum]|uniref:MFS transporter n=1 Tax=Natronospirillum operosum TaxID=2759953 RepID=A0A4Z0WAS1_9GAMM|nr:MFS transporter [Natronospirillum operosum]TGG91646.1 MFS transporter [Natronospirillum operosum]
MRNPGSKREIFGWAMYDVANQAYTTVVISFIYSAFFVSYIVPEDSRLQDTYWSIALIGSMLMAMVLSPIVGQRIDQGASKKRLLAWSTAFCVLFTCCLWFVAPGYVWLGVALLLVSNTAWMLGEAIISSFLPDLSSRRNMGVISGLGWGLGYLGGLISMVLVSILIVRADPAEDLAAYISQNQWSMVAISLYFVLFAIPTFVLVRDRRQPIDPHVAQRAWLQSLNLRKVAREQPALMRFFLAFLFYTAGVQTVIKFIGIYTSAELGMSAGDLINVFLATQISALCGAIGFGFLDRAIGARPTLLLTIGLWILAIGSMYGLQTLADWFNADPTNVFIVVALMAGTGIGSIQASSRSLVGQLTPNARAGSAFGLWGMFMRSAAILAAMFGVVADIFSRQNALLMVIGFFIIGGLLLLRVPLREALAERYAEDERREAAADDAEQVRS